MTLRGLIEAVERGEEPSMWDLAHSLGVGHMHWVGAAFNGSLDAAKRLHDALLPGFMPSVGQNVWHRYWFATVTTTVGDSIGDSFSGESTDNPARAWLLAVLKALENQHEK